MSKFVEFPADKISVSKRKLVYGIGVNDAWYQVQPTISGNRFMCQYYQVWKHMIERCYSKQYQERQPTYIGCTVCIEWLTFSVFKRWMELQDFKNKQLDKDILFPGNKIYSPNTCAFVTRQMNSLLSKRNASREYPQGVCFHYPSGKFLSRYSNNGIKKHLGLFNTVKEASVVYKKARSKYITGIANEQTDVRLKAGLLKHAKLIGECL